MFERNVIGRWPMPCRLTLYEENGQCPIFSEWSKISDANASLYIAARLDEITKAADSKAKAASDLYDYNQSLYHYPYDSWGVYYTLIDNVTSVGGLDLIVLTCGDISGGNGVKLAQLAAHRRQNL
jgi:hypothetical protein